MYPEWDRLREKLSAGARSPALAAQLAAVLPARPRLLYIASGTGEMLRWLAPRLSRAQAWVLADDTEHLVSAAFERTADWATAHGWTVTYSGRAMLVHTPAGAWRIEGFALERDATPEGLPLDRVDAFVCSALLDRVSRDWLERLLDAIRVPLFAGLVADGRIEWLPRHPADRMIRAGIARERSQSYGYGRPLCAGAPHAVIGGLSAHGFAVRSASSELRVPAGWLEATRAFVEMAADDARGASVPGKAPAIREWKAMRLRQTLAARLAVRIGQRDILGVPRRQ